MDLSSLALLFGVGGGTMGMLVPMGIPIIIIIVIILIVIGVVYWKWIK